MSGSGLRTWSRSEPSSPPQHPPPQLPGAQVVQLSSAGCALGSSSLELVLDFEVAKVNGKKLGREREHKEGGLCDHHQLESRASPCPNPRAVRPLSREVKEPQRPND